MSKKQLPYGARVIAPLLAVIAAACSTQPERVSGVADAPGVIETGERPWRATSARVVLRSYGYWVGTRVFEASRAELSAEQRALLEQLTVRAQPVVPTAEDVTTIALEITDEDGTLARYPADAPDTFGSGDTEYDLSVDFAALTPWLEPCVGTVAAGLGAGELQRPDAGATSVAERVALAAAVPRISAEDIACRHAVFEPSSCGQDIWLRLDVEAPGAYRISLDGCGFPLALRLHAPDGAAVLAAATGEVGTCPAFAHTFTQAGTYPLELHPNGCPTANADDPPVLLRVAPAEPANAGAP